MGGRIVIVAGSFALDMATAITLAYVVGQGVGALGLGQVWQWLGGVAVLYLVFNLLWVVVPGVQTSNGRMAGVIHLLTDRKAAAAKKDSDEDPNELLSGGRRKRNGIGFSSVHHAKPSVAADPAEPPVMVP